MAELLVHLRIGDLDEYCIGSISLGPNDEHVRHQVADLLRGTATIIRAELPATDRTEDDDDDRL
ncbi:hypothetical protein ACFV1L_18475 [Kitasatospora sp. NPDC059646]|uniref:hypothetical protein n=1 Tax=Kitasatospora sp. NPDC059646 TaxID=3346893 RepID=UPI00367D2EF9